MQSEFTIVPLETRVNHSAGRTGTRIDTPQRAVSAAELSHRCEEGTQKHSANPVGAALDRRIWGVVCCLRSAFARRNRLVCSGDGGSDNVHARPEWRHARRLRRIGSPNPSIFEKSIGEANELKAFQARTHPASPRSGDRPSRGGTLKRFKLSSFEQSSSSVALNFNFALREMAPNWILSQTNVTTDQIQLLIVALDEEAKAQWQGIRLGQAAVRPFGIGCC